MEDNLFTEHELHIIHRSLMLQWVSSDIWYATKGYQIWSSVNQGKSWLLLSKLRWDILSSFSTIPFISQAGRLGIYSLLRLNSGTILCIADGKIYRSVDGGTSFNVVFSEFVGRRPLRMGICQDNLGRIYLGEYFFNRHRGSVHLWRSDDDAINWFRVHTWLPGSIRHIHFVLFDPFDQNIWLGTGDDDFECQICYSLDGGYNFHTVGSGSQLWRAGSLMFTGDAVYWGTDIGIDHNDQPNYIMRYDRITGQTIQIQSIPGPAYYSTSLADGTLVIGTCVEQPNNHNDRCPYLLWTNNFRIWNEVKLWPKKSVPKIIGPATITFPLSDSPQKNLLFNTNLTRKFNGSLFELIL
jgi:hypothetical protein